MEQGLLSFYKCHYKLAVKENRPSAAQVWLHRIQSLESKMLLECDCDCYKCKYYNDCNSELKVKENVVEEWYKNESGRGIR